jgi:iron complex transport system ATP-binding protein
MDIKVTDVSVSVPKRRIVETVSLYVDEGEFIGLIGPNGSGKSTLLKSIYRTMKADSGEILVGGDNIDSLSLKESALRMGVVTQHNYYNFDFKVEEVVAMGRTPHKGMMEMDGAEDRQIVHDALEKVNMLEFKDRIFSSLSGGEQQRIILARALCQQTPCLILDEPTNHLDIKYQLEVLDIVKELGCTCLCALHDMNLAAQYCDRIYVLKDGHVITSGTPEDVITEKNIAEIYGVKATVEVSKDTGLINVVYHPKHVYHKVKTEEPVQAKPEPVSEIQEPVPVSQEPVGESSGPDQ